MATWFRKNWPIGAGILLAVGMILIFSLLTLRSKASDTGWNRDQTVQHGTVSMNTTSHSLKKIQILAKASIEPTMSPAANAHHPFEIMFDGQTHQNLEFRYGSLPVETLQAESIIESDDPRIQDLMSDLPGSRGDARLTIKY